MIELTPTPALRGLPVLMALASLAFSPTALQHYVVAPAVGQAPAGGQACLARADDDGVGDAHRCSRRCEVLAGSAAQRDRPARRDAVTCRQPASTSMDTGTPFVMMSNTADRWRDCSTTERSLSGSSPRNVKLTLICW